MWDYIVVGSGFGGSVSALRLVEAGHRVLLLEKGRRFSAEDFPTTNWDLRRWMWAPALGLRGPFKMTFLPHLTAVSGVGVGGGSLVYANTLPTPGPGFFQSPSWADLADWESELTPHYATARRMLGATRNHMLTDPDRVLRNVAERVGQAEDYGPTEVGVYFGKPGVTVPDPYFGGEGPPRTGCIGCGGCMLGCRYGSKNTLDKNYLYLAEKRGLVIRAESKVDWVRPATDPDGYWVEVLEGSDRRIERTRNVVFSGGVLGTVPLLLKLRESAQGLPLLSSRVGSMVRTNSESLIGVTTSRRDLDMSRGIAIGSIFQTDEHSHLEPVRYPAGSNFFRMLTTPHIPGHTWLERLKNTVKILRERPRPAVRAWLTWDISRTTMIMLYMRSLEGHLKLHLGRSPWTGYARGMVTSLEDGPTPTCSIPEATELAEKIAEEVEGFPQSLITETLLGIPTTAHILGGCCMGRSAEEGVIDADHRLFGYQGLYVADGSAVSANPGVNPSLTITAMAERAMERLTKSSAAQEVARPGPRSGPVEG